MSPFLQAALEYSAMGYSIIPVRHDKKPYIKWMDYQSCKADKLQIKQWWQKHPEANIGLVTGAISGATVIDADSDIGKAQIEEFLPESLIVPIVKTPKGYHFYFSHCEGISNGVRVITDTDIRNDGGYVIAPPSKNGKGQGYSWLAGLDIKEVALPEMPEILQDILKQGEAGTPFANKIDSIHLKGMYIRSDKDNHNIPQHSATFRNIGFDKGLRDDTLFYLANHLVKGNMPAENVRKFLKFYSDNCDPPFPEKEAELKIQSALSRSAKRDKNFTQEIKDWIVQQKGYISVTFLANALHCATSKEKSKLRVVLGRLVKDGKLERDKNRAGHYRIVEPCETANWKETMTDPIKIWLPFELTQMVILMPGDIVLVAGSQNAGKSALMMNIAKENRDDHNIHYFSSEMGPRTFKRRMQKFPDVSIDQLAPKIQFYERSSNFADVVKPNRGDLNLIDYLEIHDKFWLVSQYLADLHDKMDGAITIIAIQKDPQADHGRGGTFAQEKPVLTLALNSGVCKIVKCKEWQEGLDNPNGKQFLFKLVDGCRLSRRIMDLGWHYPPEK